MEIKGLSWTAALPYSAIWEVI